MPSSRVRRDRASLDIEGGSRGDQLDESFSTEFSSSLTMRSAKTVEVSVRDEINWSSRARSDSLQQHHNHSGREEERVWTKSGDPVGDRDVALP